jgi:HTH-type transcriptional regulator/antitoxin HigA
MSVAPDSVRDLPAILKGYGIILVFQKGPSGIKSDGVVTKLENGLPVIGMTLRYPRLDNFWFTLMHELSHVLLHYEEIGTPIIEDLQLEDQEMLEKQANKLTQNLLIPRKDWYRCPPRFERTNDSIIKFANKLGIHPSIVAGRLQREIDRYDLFRDIVDKNDVREIIWG